MEKQCMNIKSKHYKNIQCSNKATIKEYCKKHSKNPIQFSSSLNISASLIQKFWLKYIHRKRFSRQGPAIHCRSLANNTSEIYSLESVEKIPKNYFFSFSDSQKNIWAFDIRTLSYLLSKSISVQNPYTREYFDSKVLEKIHKRIKWLKQKKYKVMYEENTVLTSEQVWNQYVLDVFSKMDEKGYLVNPDWFHEMDKEDHINFYKKLYTLWNYRLNLTNKEKNAIIPSHNSTRNSLFKIEDPEIKEEKFLRKNNLQLIERFITSGNDKPQKGLGVMYVLMALVQVSDAVAEAFPWVYASIV